MPYLITLCLGLIIYNGFLALTLFPISPPVPKTASLNLRSYLAQKEIPVQKPRIEFAELISPPQVLGAETENPEAALDSENEASPSGKSHYTVAVLGDSMVDTLGPDLPHMVKALKERFPLVTFTLLNYGAGATNIESGLSRLTNDYDYLGVHKPAVLSQNPDIIVIESFAYNHWEGTQSDLDRQWIAIAGVIETIKIRNPSTKIVLAATIAPFCATYTDGSANLPLERKFSECQTVMKYLQNLVNFATSQNYPLADAYHASLNGTEGNPKYINQSDHIHPSDSGKQLFAEKVSQAIDLMVN